MQFNYHKKETLMLPESIPTGMNGWRVRRLERKAIKIIAKATCPQHGGDIYEKMIKGKASSEVPKWERLSKIMADLFDRGYLDQVACDPDYGATYQLPAKQE